MMNASNTVGLLILTLLLSTNCTSNKVRIRSVLEKFEQTHVTIPEDMTMICNGKILPPNVKDSVPSLVVYVSEDECSDCRVSHLWDYSELFEWSEKSKLFQVILIFAPKQEEVDYIVEHIQSLGFVYPIYIDSYSVFAENAIPKESFTHTFLLDKHGYPVLVGDPIGNEQLMDLYKSVINN